MKTRRFMITLVITLLFAVGPGAYAWGEEGAAGEYRIKAAFLYNFAKFVDWPDHAFAGPGGPITLGILGDNPFGEALDTIRGKTVKGRRLVIRSVSRPEDADQYQMLFICSSEQHRLSRILGLLQGRPVLTVGDMQNFVGLGGMINLVREEKKIRFEVNMGPAHAAGLRISSKLLKLARTVNPKMKD